LVLWFFGGYRTLEARRQTLTSSEGSTVSD
jgi:hypothetical protein